MFACAFIVGYLAGARMYSDAGKPQEEIDRLLIYVLIATIVGARLGHVFFYEAEFYLRNIHLIPQVWTGGWRGTEPATESFLGSTSTQSVPRGSILFGFLTG